MGKYCVTTVWNYRGKPEEQYERCIITPLPDSEEDYEGDSCMNSYSGIDCFVRDSLEEAIAKSQFNPFAIEFKGLSADELKQKDDLLAKCTWLPEEGTKVYPSPAEKPKVITLCGSTKFKSEFEQKNKELTLAGNLVISVGLFGHSGDVINDDQKIMLDMLHKRKIDLADAIYVINKGGYIGISTMDEIQYAEATGKEIIYMEEPSSSRVLEER